jgi:hypothetical protein
MECGNSALYLFCILLVSLTSATDAAAITHSHASTPAKLPLSIRADANLTSLTTNATALLQELDYTGNCTVAISWYKNLPSSGSSAGFGNDTLNVEFLRTTLPPAYENATNEQVAGFYDDLSTGELSGSGWIGTAKDSIEAGCITPQIERHISLSNLNATQNCTATAIFLSSLGWLTGPKKYDTASYNNTSWLEFLYGALPLEYQRNITQVELYVYRNFFLASGKSDDITNLLNQGYISCQKDICMVQGYTGNPDISGIGVSFVSSLQIQFDELIQKYQVMCSYSVEVALVTLYFLAINLRIWLKGADLEQEEKTGTHSSSKIHQALEKASEGLLDGALFFSLSISSAGWVSFHSGQSYYEKLVFTSANVLALSALFAFLGMFTAEGRKKRGEYILGTMLAGILVESGIQYIVYLKEPSEKYQDYACLHEQFLDQGYHPAVFEALFFLLLGLSVIAGIVAFFWVLKNAPLAKKVQKTNADSKEKEDKQTGPETLSTSTPAQTSSSTAAQQPPTTTKKIPRYHKVEFWVTVTRILIQVVALVVMWVELVYLWRIRNIMSKIAGDTWVEGSWGFGQILALFIWLPPVIDIVGWLGMSHFHRSIFILVRRAQRR